jgi:hypothetical protein
VNSNRHEVRIQATAGKVYEAKVRFVKEGNPVNMGFRIDEMKVAQGWKHFSGSLTSYVETGTGQPW